MLEFVINGGPMMIGLLAFSVLGLGVLLDRAIAFYQHSKIDNRALRAKVLTLFRDGRTEDAAMLCAATPGPVSAVLLAGIQSYTKHQDHVPDREQLTSTIEKAMDDYALHAVSAVEKRLNILATIGNAAPLLGMAGTVLGMIGAFGTIEQLEGLDAVAVGGDIAEALITTFTGLIIALAAVIPYNFFSSMANQIELEIEEATTELLEFIQTEVQPAPARADTPRQPETAAV